MKSYYKSNCYRRKFEGASKNGSKRPDNGGGRREINDTDKEKIAALSKSEIRQYMEVYAWQIAYWTHVRVCT